MASGRTFKFMEQMHLNQGTKGPTMISFVWRHLGSKVKFVVWRITID